MNIAIILIAVFTAVASSIVGVFLVLRKMSMMTDAINHTVLLGIVFGYLITSDLNSPVLILGATLMGVLTTYLIELLVKTKRTSEDAATGVIFPLLFSIAVIIISLSFRDVHLDVDAVLLGNLEFQVFDKWTLFGYNMGPKSLYIMLFVALLNITYLIIFYKELKIVSFDSALAATVGISPIIIHYSLMFLVSLTSVTAFNAVGSILVIAMMVGPPITALLITDDLFKTIIISVAISIFNSIVGYFFALYFDVVISGMISTITLITFLIVFLFNPKSGVLFKIVRRYNQKIEFSILALLIHINNHEEQMNKYNLDEIKQKQLLDLNYNENKYFNLAINKEYLKLENNYLKLTIKGKDLINKQELLNK